MRKDASQILTYVVFTIMLFEGNVSKKQILIISVFRAKDLSRCTTVYSDQNSELLFDDVTYFMKSYKDLHDYFLMRIIKDS